MTNATNCDVLRQDFTPGVKMYVDIAYEALQPVASALFQARKCGVTVTIPEPVRQQMIASHGVDAIAMLDFLDGRVRL